MAFLPHGGAPEPFQAGIPLLPLREKVPEGRMRGLLGGRNPSSPLCGPSPARGEGAAAPVSPSDRGEGSAREKGRLSATSHDAGQGHPRPRRLHLQHGPIDLIVAAYGAPEAVATAYHAAARRFATILEELCDELPALRTQASADAPRLFGPVARRMARAVAPFAAETFITPMAAVAGAVAEEILAALVGAARLDRAFVNNGGDIALHLAPGASFTIGLIDRPDRPGLFGRTRIAAEHLVRGIATSGWGGRSFSLGIADAVTVLAGTAAAADAAATVIANAVDLPDHPGVDRVPASSVQVDSDLGDRLVTRAVATLDPHEIDAALASGARCAENLLARGLIEAAALHCQGRTRVAGLESEADAGHLLHTFARPTFQSSAHA